MRTSLAKCCQDRKEDETEEMKNMTGGPEGNMVFYPLLPAEKD
jgi:hypothetical protein